MASDTAHDLFNGHFGFEAIQFEVESASNRASACSTPEPRWDRVAPAILTPSPHFLVSVEAALTRGATTSPVSRRTQSALATPASVPGLPTPVSLRHMSLRATPATLTPEHASVSSEQPSAARSHSLIARSPPPSAPVALVLFRDDEPAGAGAPVSDGAQLLESLPPGASTIVVAPPSAQRSLKPDLEAAAARGGAHGEQRARARMVDGGDATPHMVDYLRRRAPAALLCAALVATLTFVAAVAAPVDVDWAPTEATHGGSSAATLGAARPVAMAETVDAAWPHVPLTWRSGAYWPEEAALAPADAALASGEAEPTNAVALAAAAAERAPAALALGAWRPPGPALGAAASGWGTPSTPPRLSCAECATGCARTSPVVCCTRLCVADCPYAMHTAGCALPADDDWRRLAPAGTAVSCPLECAAASAGAEQCTLGASPTPATVSSSRALVMLIDHMCAGARADLASGLMARAGFLSPALGDACAQARSDEASGCSLAARVDFLLCRTSVSQFGLCCNRLGGDGAARCGRSLRQRARLGATLGLVALGALLSAAIVFFGRFALCWGRALMSSRSRPFALAACAVCWGCVGVRKLKRCFRARCPGLLGKPAVDGWRWPWDAAREGAHRVGTAARQAPLQILAAAGRSIFEQATIGRPLFGGGGGGGGGGGVDGEQRSAREEAAARRRAGEGARALARPRAGEGVAWVVLSLLFVIGSVGYWHARYDLLGPPSAIARCEVSCEAALGGAACAARNVSSAAAPICRSRAVARPSGAPISDFACVCARAPLYACREAVTQYAGIPASSGRRGHGGVEYTTGVCEVEPVRAVWAGAVALAALVVGGGVVALLLRLGRCLLGADRGESEVARGATGARALGAGRGAPRRGLAPSTVYEPEAAGGGCGADRLSDFDDVCAVRVGPADPGAACGTGALGTALNLLLLPLLIVWNALAIYALPCVGAYARRLRGACVWAACAPCRAHAPRWCFFEYVDREFPPTAASIGPKLGVHTWARAPELALAAPQSVVARKARPAADARPCLFNGGPDAGDVDQGGLGDCWLMSAFACAAEVPGLVESLFDTRVFSPRGKYVVRLWDANEARWRRIAIDDWIPATSGAPAFARPGANEMWVMLLEKAFAKHVGSYAALDGGRTMWALNAITGDHVFPLYKKGGRWTRWHVSFEGDATDRRRIAERPSGEGYDADTLWGLLLQYQRKGAIIAVAKFNDARGGKREVRDERLGVVAGHAYSVLDVEEVTSLPSGHAFRLVKLRNPWGDFPWKGAWSDGAAEWARYPDLRERLFPLGSHGAGEVGADGRADGGTFWMAFADFETVWESIEICDRSSGVRDLALDYNEEDGCAGPALGCVLGCGWYWCCCQGIGALLCKHSSSVETDELEGAPMRCVRGVPSCLQQAGNASARVCSCQTRREGTVSDEQYN